MSEKETANTEEQKDVVVEAKVEDTATGVKKGAIDFDDVDDIVNPIIPVMPDANHKCVYVILTERPVIKLVGKDNDKPAIIYKFHDPIRKADAVINQFLPTPLADQVNEKEERMAKSNFGNIKHVLGALIPGGIKNVSGDTYHEVVQAVIDSIPESSIGKDIKLNVKLVYNKQGYLGFPMIPPFISSDFKLMDFKWNSTYDFIDAPDKKAAGGGSTEQGAVDIEKYSSM